MPRHRDAEIAAPARVDFCDGLAYALFEPDAAPARRRGATDGEGRAGIPRGGVVIIHGAGSCKESHFDFARECRAAGLQAICFDLRGHGASGGALGAGTLDDVARIAGLLAPGRPRFLRGSSLGGFLAIAAAARVGARGVVAICPAGREQLLRGLRTGAYDFAVQQPGLEAFIASVDLSAAAAALGPDLLLLHAEGDEQVPVEHSGMLHGDAAGSRFIRIPGGHHRSVQHDLELQAAAVAFLVSRAAAAPG